MKQGTRIDDMGAIIGRIAEVITLFDDDGVSIRFINNDENFDNIKDTMAVFSAVKSLEYKYGTEIGTALDEKIIQPLVIDRLESGELTKPVLIFIITDGEPSFEPRTKLREVMLSCMERATGAGVPKVISVAFAQVGNDHRATEFLQELDDDKEIGHFVDTISDFDTEKGQLARKDIMLTPELYLLKLLLGSVDPRYDELD